MLKETKVTINQNFSKTVKVLANSDKDNNWKELFSKEHWDINSLLNVLKDYLVLDMCKHISNRNAKTLEVLYMACNNWSEDKFEVTKS